MKTLSITEPYASLICEGKKHIETRSWKTNYRGPLLIHASATRIPHDYKHLVPMVSETRQGNIICKANLVDCVEMTREWISEMSEKEWFLGFYSVGRYAWILEDVEPIEPIPAKGRLGLWDYKEVAK